MADAKAIEDAVRKALEALHDKFPGDPEAVETAVKDSYSDKPVTPKRKRGVKGSVGRPPIDKVALAVWAVMFVTLFQESVKPRRQSIRWACQEIAKLGLRYTMAANNNPAPMAIKAWQTVMRYYSEARTLENDERFDRYGSTILLTLSYWLGVEPPFLDQELAKQWRKTQEHLWKGNDITPWDGPPLLALPGGMNLLIGPVNRTVYERLQRGMGNLNKRIMEALSST